MNKREKVYSKTNGKCIYCGCNIDFKTFHVEHMIPKKSLKNDYNNIKNLFPSCQDCNLSKGDLTIEQFRNKIENMTDERHIGRLIKKYYLLVPKKIKFYFEINEVK